MNGIRLAVFSTAAILILFADAPKVDAQRGPGRDYQEQAKRAQEAAMMGSLGENPGMQPGDEPASKSSRSSRSSRGSSSSNRSNGRSTARSSRSRGGSNAIETNPLFQLFDENGDGELSLEEIDAASRLLYSLDSNQDDTITSDEVEDMVAGDEMSDRDDEENDRRTSRSSRDNRSTSRSNRSRGGNSGAATGGNSKFAGGAGGMGLPGDGDGGGQSRSSRGSSRGSSRSGGGGKFAGGAGGMGMGGVPDAGGSRRGSSRGARNSSKSNDDFGSFADYDENGDGILQRGEAPSKLRTKLRRMDSNGDSEVDEDEYNEYFDNQ